MGDVDGASGDGAGERAVAKDPDVVKIITRAFMEHPLLSAVTAKIREDLISVMFPLEVKNKTVITTQGSISDRFCVMTHGRCAVSVKRKTISKYDAPKIFGAVSLMHSLESPVTVRCIGKGCEVYVLPGKKFIEALASVDTESVRARYCWLRKVSFFARLHSFQLAVLAEALSPETFAAGERICLQGDVCEGLYIIEEGTVAVQQFHRLSGKTLDLSVLSKGDIFGERALLCDRAFDSTTIAASVKVTLLCLPRARFKPLLGNLKDKLTSAALAQEDANKKIHNRASRAWLTRNESKTSGKGDGHMAMSKEHDTQIKQRGQEDQDINFLLLRRSYASGAAKRAPLISGTKLSSSLSSVATIDPDTHRFEEDCIEHAGKGFGPTLLMRHKTSKELVACKCISKVALFKRKRLPRVFADLEMLKIFGSAHPFVTELMGTFQDVRCLYLITRFAPGGSLKTMLYGSSALKLTPLGGWAQGVARMYASMLLAVIQHMHACGFMWRGCKLENLLVGEDGYLVIKNFRVAKHIRHGNKSYTLCGSPEYLAPEMLLGVGHNSAVDWWAFGVVIYEMLVRHSPFADKKSPKRIFVQILHAKQSLQFPAGFPPLAKDLVSRFLRMDPTNRLGSALGGDESVRAQRWFKGVDWDKLEAKAYAAPYVPEQDDFTSNGPEGDAAMKLIGKLPPFKNNSMLVNAQFAQWQS